MKIKSIKNITIIGVGLIGGSIGLALKKSKGVKVKITGVGRNIRRLQLAKKLKAVDEITLDLKEGVKNAEVVFVCLPIDLIAPTVKKIIPYCQKKTIITDVGSIKEPIVKKIKTANFVGGHPIAGSEKTSVQYASANLFSGATVVLTPTSQTSPAALATIKKLWKIMNARTIITMPAATHDRLIAFTSHLPHILAFALINSINDFSLVGPGFRDTTRIASADSKIWSEIIWQNRKNISAALSRFQKELLKIKNARHIIQLQKICQRAKNIRDRLYEQK